MSFPDIFSLVVILLYLFFFFFFLNEGVRRCTLDRHWLQTSKLQHAATKIWANLSKSLAAPAQNWWMSEENSQQPHLTTCFWASVGVAWRPRFIFSTLGPDNFMKPSFLHTCCSFSCFYSLFLYLQLFVLPSLTDSVDLISSRRHSSTVPVVCSCWTRPTLSPFFCFALSSPFLLSPHLFLI